MKETRSIKVSKKAHRKLRIMSAKLDKPIILIIDEYIITPPSGRSGVMKNN